MKLAKLKIVLDELYDFDIFKKTRKREYAYAKKVFSKLAFDYGHSWCTIEKFCGIKHDVLIYYYNTFNTVNALDLEKYNACIDYFNLNLDKIPNINWFMNGEVIYSINQELKHLDLKDLKYFKNKIVPNFLAAIKKEQEYKNIINGS